MGERPNPCLGIEDTVTEVQGQYCSNRELVGTVLTIFSSVFFSSCSQVKNNSLGQGLLLNKTEMFGPNLRQK